MSDLFILHYLYAALSRMKLEENVEFVLNLTDPDIGTTLVFLE